MQLKKLHYIYCSEVTKIVKRSAQPVSANVVAAIRPLCTLLPSTEARKQHYIMKVWTQGTGVPFVTGPVSTEEASIYEVQLSDFCEETANHFMN